MVCAKSERGAQQTETGCKHVSAAVMDILAQMLTGSPGPLESVKVGTQCTAVFGTFVFHT